jgi:phage-related protein
VRSIFAARVRAVSENELFSNGLRWAMLDSTKPADVRRLFGFALSLAQAGDKHDAAKVVKGFGGAGVLEVVEDDIGGTYRAVYTVKFAEAVFVLR